MWLTTSTLNLLSLMRRLGSIGCHARSRKFLCFVSGEQCVHDSLVEWLFVLVPFKNGALSARTVRISTEMLPSTSSTSLRWSLSSHAFNLGLRCLRPREGWSEAGGQTSEAHLRPSTESSLGQRCRASSSSGAPRVLQPRVLWRLTIWVCVGNQEHKNGLISQEPLLLATPKLFEICCWYCSILPAVYRTWMVSNLRNAPRQRTCAALKNV